MVIDNIKQIQDGRIKLSKLTNNTLYICNTCFVPSSKKYINLSQEKRYRFFGGERTPILGLIADYCFYNFKRKNTRKKNVWIGAYIKDRNILFIADAKYTSSYLEETQKYIANTIIGILKKHSINVELSLYKNINLNKITYGVDIEFEPIKSGEPVNTRPSIRDGKSLPVYFLGSIQPTTTARLGLDYLGGPIELRPKEGRSEGELTRNFTNLFTQLKYDKKRNRHNLSVIGNKDALGGHIHFGIGKIMKPSESLLSDLDLYVGKKLIGLSGKARGRYRDFSKYETKKYGFEYRTPPAAYCESPKIFRIVIKIARLVFEHHMKNKKISTNGKWCATRKDYINLGMLPYEIDTLNEWKKDYKRRLKSKKAYKVNVVKNW